MRSFARVLGLLPGLLAIGAMVQPSAAADSPTLTRIKSSGAITIGYREASIPFSYLGADQKPVGFSLDLCAAIVDQIKADLKLPSLSVNYTPVNSSNRIPLIQNGTVDIECGGTANDRKRQEQVSFSVATFVSQPRWLVKADSGLKSAADLKGKTIVVTQGSNAVGFAQAVNGKEQLGLNIVQAKDHAESFLTLNTGRAAAFMEDDILLGGSQGRRAESESVDAPSRRLRKDFLWADVHEGRHCLQGARRRGLFSGRWHQACSRRRTRSGSPARFRRRARNSAFPLTDALKVENCASKRRSRLVVARHARRSWTR